jgi:hypothetical protein
MDKDEIRVLLDVLIIHCWGLFEVFGRALDKNEQCAICILSPKWQFTSADSAEHLEAISTQSPRFPKSAKFVALPQAGFKFAVCLSGWAAHARHWPLSLTNSIFNVYKQYNTMTEDIISNIDDGMLVL